MTRTADVVRMSGDEYGRLMDEREILRQEASRAWREVDFIAKERTEHLEWRTKLANDLDECERMRDALRAELREATEAMDDPAVNNLRTLPEAIRMLRAERDALRVVQPSAFDPAAAMRLADDYAFAQSQLDEKRSTSRKYYVEGRDEARAALAAYLGIKEAK